jgi:hypothetical protein
VDNSNKDLELSRGKYYTIATIGAISCAVVGILVMFYTTKNIAFLSIGTWIHVAFIVSCCLSLYFGSNWPKWIIGLYCIFLSGMAFKILFNSHLYFNFISLIMIVWALTSIYLSILLMFSNSVKKYLNYQYNNRTITVKKAIKSSWIIFFLIILIILISDVNRLFFN